MSDIDIPASKSGSQVKLEGCVDEGDRAAAAADNIAACVARRAALLGISQDSPPIMESMQAKHLLESIRRDATAKPLVFDANDVIPVDLRALAGTTCQEIQTDGDGACALHAAWGHINPARSQLECANSRRRLREILNHPFDTIVSHTRPHMRELLDKVTTSLWQDFVVQSLSTGAVAREEHMFMSRLSDLQHQSFLAACREHLQTYRTSKQNRDEAFRTMQD